MKLPTKCSVYLKILYFIILFPIAACQEKPQMRHRTRYKPSTTSDKFEVRKNKENIESVQVPDTASSFYIRFNTGINIEKIYAELDEKSDTILLYNIYEKNRERKPPYGFAHRDTPYYSMTYMSNGRLKCIIKQNDSYKERRFRIEYMVGYDYFDKFYIIQEGKMKRTKRESYSTNK